MGEVAFYSRLDQDSRSLPESEDMAITPTQIDLL
jgi:hypothetical protein